jgi:hypothetical protein
LPTCSKQKVHIQIVEELLDAIQGRTGAEYVDDHGFDLGTGRGLPLRRMPLHHGVDGRFQL